MPAQTIANSKTTTPTMFGGDALNNINRYLNGVDVTSVIGTPIIRTPTKFPSDKLIFTDPAEDNTVTVKIPALSANKNINLIPSGVVDNDEVVYKDTVQTVTGKVIDAGSNTISNLTNSNIGSSAAIAYSKLNLANSIVNADISSSAAITDTKLAQITDKNKQHAQTAYKDTSNTFTAIQNIESASQGILNLYRQTNSSGSNTIFFDMQNASSTKKNFGLVSIRSDAVTASSEQGSFRVALTEGGTTNIEQLKIVGGLVTIGKSSGNRVILDPNSITSSDKTWTFQNATDTFVGRATSDTLTNKSLDLMSNTVTRLSKYGVIAANKLRGITSHGMFDGAVTLGNELDTSNNSTGNFCNLQTRSGSNNDTSGVIKIGGILSKRIRNPLLRFVFIFDHNNTSNRRIFKGFGPNRLLDTSGTEPVTSSESCFLFGHGASDTAFYIFHNDGGGTCVKDTTGISLPPSQTGYILEIQAVDSSSGFRWTLWTMSTLGDKSSQVGTGLVTTRVPGQTTALYFHDVVQSPIANLVNNSFYYTEVFTS